MNMTIKPMMKRVINIILCVSAFLSSFVHSYPFLLFGILCILSHCTSEGLGRIVVSNQSTLVSYIYDNWYTGTLVQEYIFMYSFQVLLLLSINFNQCLIFIEHIFSSLTLFFFRNKILTA